MKNIYKQYWSSKSIYFHKSFYAFEAKRLQCLNILRQMENSKIFIFFLYIPFTFIHHMDHTFNREEQRPCFWTKSRVP